MSNIRTRTGDFGSTDIKDQRVYKDSELVGLIGDLDETMAYFILAHNLKPDDINGFEHVVDNLILISAIVAGYKPIEDFSENEVLDIENEIVHRGESFTDFTYPFNDVFKARMNVLRTVVRRAERQAHSVLRGAEYNTIKTYLNALSDYVFTYIK